VYDRFPKQYFSPSLEDPLDDCHLDGVDVKPHNHLIGEFPDVMYMHIASHGDAVQMAKAIHEAVALTKTPTPDAAPAALSTAELGFDQKQVEQILGPQGRLMVECFRSECRGRKRSPIWA
jgi:hypothetical protein